MSPSRRTWLWILVAVLGLGIIFVIGVAGAGMYFVSKHFKSSRTSTGDAIKAIDEARSRFKNDKPLFVLDKSDNPRMMRKLEDMPTSTTKTEAVYVIAWDPDRERLVRVSLPFWMLKLGRQKIDISSGGLDFQRLQLDMKQLQRVGPILLFDVRTPNGEHVVVWTQ